MSIIQNERFYPVLICKTGIVLIAVLTTLRGALAQFSEYDKQWRISMRHAESTKDVAIKEKSLTNALQIATTYNLERDKQVYTFIELIELYVGNKNYRQANILLSALEQTLKHLDRNVESSNLFTVLLFHSKVLKQAGNVAEAKLKSEELRRMHPVICPTGDISKLKPLANIGQYYIAVQSEVYELISSISGQLRGTQYVKVLLDESGRVLEVESMDITEGHNEISQKIEKLLTGKTLRPFPANFLKQQKRLEFTF
jgi:hypothetical protein